MTYKIDMGRFFLVSNNRCGKTLLTKEFHDRLIESITSRKAIKKIRPRKVGGSRIMASIFFINYLRKANNIPIDTNVPINR